MQQQPHRWLGFDKWVETKLRLDVYIRPWPPAWSYLRRIYTSCGSERVKNMFEFSSINLRDIHKCLKGALSHYAVFLCHVLAVENDGEETRGHGAGHIFFFKFGASQLINFGSFVHLPMQNRSPFPQSQAVRTDQESENERTRLPRNGGQ